MKRETLIICKLLLLLTFFNSPLNAQITVSTGGNIAVGNGSSSTFTVGQIFYHTIGTSAISLSEGVQQPFETSIISAIPKTKMSTNRYLIYPNPADDFIKIKIESYNGEEVGFQLINEKGETLRIGKILTDETQISLNGYVSTVYFLRIVEDTNSVITYKIIKR